MKNSITINSIEYVLKDAPKKFETSYECYDYCALNQVCRRLVDTFQLAPCTDLFLTDDRNSKYFQIKI